MLQWLQLLLDDRSQIRLALAYLHARTSASSEVRAPGSPKPPSRAEPE